MPYLIILRGVPGSGKTTWALDYCEAHRTAKRVSKDDLRAMLTHANAVTFIVALVALAALITLARIVWHHARVRRTYRESPGLERAMRIRDRYRGQG